MEEFAIRDRIARGRPIRGDDIQVQSRHWLWNRHKESYPVYSSSSNTCLITPALPSTAISEGHPSLFPAHCSCGSCHISLEHSCHPGLLPEAHCGLQLLSVVFSLSTYAHLLFTCSATRHCGLTCRAGFYVPTVPCPSSVSPRRLC